MVVHIVRHGELMELVMQGVKKGRVAQGKARLAYAEQIIRNVRASRYTNGAAQVDALLP